jgi:hypothetical protein
MHSHGVEPALPALVRAATYARARHDRRLREVLLPLYDQACRQHQGAGLRGALRKQLERLGHLLGAQPGGGGRQHQSDGYRQEQQQQQQQQQQGGHADRWSRGDGSSNGGGNGNAGGSGSSSSSSQNADVWRPGMPLQTQEQHQQRAGVSRAMVDMLGGSGGEASSDGGTRLAGLRALLRGGGGSADANSSGDEAAGGASKQ